MPEPDNEHESTRERMLQAAGPIFAEQGYAGATVRELCKAADVNVASVNYHFGDKHQLYIETVRRAHQARMKTADFPAWSESTPPEEKLFDFVRTLVTRMLSPSGQPWQTRLMMREILQPTAACQELVQDHFRPQMNALMQIMLELTPSDPPPSELRRLAFSVVGQCLYYRFAGDVVGLLTPAGESRAHDDLELLTEHITRFSLGALRNWSTSLLKTSLARVDVGDTTPDVETAHE